MPVARARTVIALIAAASFVGAGVVMELGAGGVHVRSVAAAGADVEIDEAMRIDDALTTVTLAERAIAHVEAAFGRSFAPRPKIVVFDSADAFGRGMVALFGYAPTTATSFASEYGGMFDRPSLTVALTREPTDSATQDLMVHELTHLMVREITRGATLPAWLEEGLATVVTETDDPASVWLEDELLEGRALAASGLVAFASLDELAGWHAAFARLGNSVYAYGSVAVREMERQVGWAGVREVLWAVGRGESFADAYARDAGETTATLEGRMRQTAVATLLVRSRPDRDDDVLWTLFTGVPNSETSVTISGARSYRVTFAVTTDGLGMYRGVFGSTAEPGRYLIDAAGLEAILDTER